MLFQLESNFAPTGDQPEAIKQLENGINNKIKYQTLLGVTGSGKTFTIANIINNLNKPTLVLSHNKTLAAQLFNEFKQFFPENSVEYFVSYYDYYQPEAYIASTGTYIEKDLSINDEIEKYRLKTTASLLSGRKDIIVVSSVSCIYGIGNPDDFHKNTIHLKVGDKIIMHKLLADLVGALYSRTNNEFKRGSFRVAGDSVEVYLSHEDLSYKIYFFGNEIDEICIYNPNNSKKIKNLDSVKIFPANIFVTSKNKVHTALENIQNDLSDQINYFEKLDLSLEAKRIKERTNYDIEMIKELGYCSGIENYSRYFDGRKAGTRPFCLLDYFPNDFLTIIDESHVTLPQIRAMYGGDKSRKKNLVDHGFRLPSALDNRPLKFEEFEEINSQTIYVSATPSDYELEKCHGSFIEQIIRPTGLLDPKIQVKSSKNQIDHLLSEINSQTKNNERTLVITLTKRMAEEFSKYLSKFNIKCKYIHSDIDTLERIEIIDELKKGTIDVLIGVNLLREGLDLPEVSLVAIMDADKEGFLRSHRALTQISGRAARNINGRVIMYADIITDSMKKTIEETNRRRTKQKQYNKQNNITPKPILKKKSKIENQLNPYKKSQKNIEIIIPNSDSEIQNLITRTKQKMIKHAKDLNFLEAAKLRDQITLLKKEMKQKKSEH